MAEGEQNPSPGTGLPASDEFVTIASVVKTQGRIGEVAAMLFTDFPERFASRTRLFALHQDGRRRELALEDHWFHKGQVVLKFKGVDSISDAEALVRCEIQIPHRERAKLDDDTFYSGDLAGSEVFDQGHRIGVIQEVQFGAGEAPLLVIKGVKEYLVPFVAEYIEKIALEQKRIEMKLPKGMLELDAPLTADEKQRQRDAG
jgi:16S rRNA processing protein RimM